MGSNGVFKLEWDYVKLLHGRKVYKNLFFSKECNNININVMRRADQMPLFFFLGRRGVTLTLLCKFKIKKIKITNKCK